MVDKVFITQWISLLHTYNNITFAERLVTKTGNFHLKEADAQCSCYTKVWRGLACFFQGYTSAS